MSDKQLPSPELLRQLLQYDPETGKLFWAERLPNLFETESAAKTWNAKHAGKEAFTSKDTCGYPRGSIFNRLHSAHRVIWAIYTGKWPFDHIDHINGNPSDNRIENLRVASQAQNQKNRKKPVHNSSGSVGVYKQRKKWSARIQVDGKNIYLGSFANFDEAVCARQAANIKYEFHENHGKR